MSLPGFQQEVARFVAVHRLETAVETRLLDLTSEVGELAKEALKATRYGQEPFRPTPDWEMEMADMFFALVCAANSTGVNLEEALGKALTKYGRRLQATGDSGSGR